MDTSRYAARQLGKALSLTTFLQLSPCQDMCQTTSTEGQQYGYPLSINARSGSDSGKVDRPWGSGEQYRGCRMMPAGITHICLYDEVLLFILDTPTFGVWCAHSMLRNQRTSSIYWQKDEY
ncbi:hypothetical protein F4774DRAFT_81056 [Daldinia eschscholtzii]|nr:hypothetical protein F4774DRAFT_81056 [Daldinia eschscholtzii]